MFYGLNITGMQRRHRRGDAKFSSDPPSPGVRHLPTSCRSGGGRPGLVGAVGVLRPLQLHFESLHADLEAVHRLDGSLGAAWVVEAHKACGGWGEGVGEGGGTGVTALDGGAVVIREEWVMKNTSVWWSGVIRILQLTAARLQHRWQLTKIMHL